MRRWLAWAMVLALALTGCAAPADTTTLKIGTAESLTVRSGTTGETVEITDPADIGHITENLETMAFQDQGEVDADGWTYSLEWLDGEGTSLERITLMGDGHTIIHDGYFYEDADGEIDLEYLEELFASDALRNWGIKLAVEDAGPTGLTLLISQSGEEPGEFFYGDEYTLEVLRDGQWERVPYATDEEVRPGCLWDGFPAGESREVKLAWEHLYGQLEAGTYRLSKAFSRDGSTGDLDWTTVSVEFTIEP